MSSSRYVNHFRVNVRNETQEAIMMFRNVYALYDGELECSGGEYEDVAYVVMTKNNLEDLYRVIGNVLENASEME